jgi:hypothetical protein
MATVASMYRVFRLPIVCSIKTSGWSLWLFSLPIVHVLDDQRTMIARLWLQAALELVQI